MPNEQTIPLTALRRPAPAEPTAVHFVAMPWPPPYTPNLPIAQLTASLRQARPDRPVHEHHAALAWYNLMLDTYGDVRARDIYTTVADGGAYLGVGDYIFSSTLSPVDGATEAEYAEIVADLDLPPLPELRALADRFSEAVAAEVAAAAPPGAIVGFSSTYTQTVPSLAAIIRLKAKRPDVRVVLGGFNMNKERAELFTRAYPVDTVVVGEGEDALIELAATCDAGGELPPVVEAPWVDMCSLPAPDFAGYFDALESSGVEHLIEPKLGYEIGRGCWWGERRHCTFCGLNGERMTYRRRSPEQVLTDLTASIRRYRVLDIFFADNILHPDDVDLMFGKLPPDLDLRMHLEVKSNLTREEMTTLRAGGVWHMQPGIESLARRPLHLMRKGVTPMMNLRFLRNGEELGLSVSWNILAGFPGETWDDYQPMVTQMPKAFHLQPPGSIGRIGYVRYSPLVEDPTLGAGPLSVGRFNSLVYRDLDPDDVRTMTDVFVTAERLGIGDEHIAELSSLAEEWRTRYPDTLLYEEADAGEVAVHASGEAGPVAVLTEAWQLDLWDGLRAGVSRRGLAELADRHGRADLIDEFVEEMAERGLVWADEGAFLALPTRFDTHAAVKRK